jgi:hypothetical protein
MRSTVVYAQTGLSHFCALPLLGPALNNRFTYSPRRESGARARDGRYGGVERITGGDLFREALSAVKAQTARQTSLYDRFCLLVTKERIVLFPRTTEKEG